jgi:ketosteroid isomerase-like protein
MQRLTEAAVGLALMAASTVSACATPASHAMGSQAIITARFAAINRHDIDAAVALYAADATLTASDFCAPRHGRADVERTLRGIFQLVNDLNADVESMVTQGDRVAVRFVVRGNVGGHPIAIPIMDFYTVRDGLIVADDGIFDTGGRPCSP